MAPKPGGAGRTLASLVAGLCVFAGQAVALVAMLVVTGLTASIPNDAHAQAAQGSITCTGDITRAANAAILFVADGRCTLQDSLDGSGDGSDELAIRLGASAGRTIAVLSDDGMKIGSGQNLEEIIECDLPGKFPEGRRPGLCIRNRVPAGVHDLVAVAGSAANGGVEMRIEAEVEIHGALGYSKVARARLTGALGHGAAGSGRWACDAPHRNDLVRPTVRIDPVPSPHSGLQSGRVVSNAPFPVTITFSEPVIGFGVGAITVGNGRIAAGSFSAVEQGRDTGRVYRVMLRRPVDQRPSGST